MDVESVRERRAALDDRMAAAQAEVEKVGVDLRALQRSCRHPNARDASHMGEMCRHCYDCGACDV